jgi:hypothetical protein
MSALTKARRCRTLFPIQRLIMKKKSIIITDPKKLFEASLRQPRVSQEEMRRSVVAGIQSAHTRSPAKVN